LALIIPAGFMSISAIIITFNEERNIARCIHALKGLADEVIVVDSFSTDQTVSIAEGLGAKVIRHAFEGYGEQKRLAIDQASYDWILSLDADEEVSPELRQSILAIKGRETHAAYQFPFLTNYCGKWIRHCGWYPNPKVRFWDKRQGEMTIDKVHEGWKLHDPVATIGTLKGDILHYSFPTISAHLKKIEQYSEIGARFDVARGKKVSLLKLWLAPKWSFLVDFIIRGGILDGYYGYIVCKNSAFAAYAKYAKIRQYTKLQAEGLSF
jgi:glycosyltransferase involved in cell wall biosynthesis